MKKIKTNSLTTFGCLILSVVILTTNACVKQAASKIEPAEPLTTSSADAEIAAAQKFIEKSPDAAKGYNLLAARYIRLARETGDFGINSNAETAVSRALEVEPANLEAKRTKASLLLTFHRFAEALEYGTKLQQENPQDAIIYGVLTDANVELGNYPAAIDAAQKMVDLRPNMESYARVAAVRSLHGDADGAIEALSLAARIADPQDREAQAWCFAHLGDEYFKVGKFAEAEKQYETALRVFPDYHFGLAGKGRARAAAGDLENAVKFYTQAQTRVPATLTVISLGDVYAKSGNAAKAQEQYDLAVFIEQKLGNLDQRTLALLWADQNVKLDEALAIAEREHAARQDIYTADIYAWCLYKKGNFQAAQKISLEAMRLKTKNALFFYHAGMIEKALGNNKAAKDLLQKALQTNPSFDVLQAEKAQTALTELK
ncbi:MAG: tetratricopeptide repeat protein [Pyrinomonadaceae bacterium]|nr:tetratricopeptide repeat protein [Pyrinomonadaceae bacterium]